MEGNKKKSEFKEYKVNIILTPQEAKYVCTAAEMLSLSPEQLIAIDYVMLLRGFHLKQEKRGNHA